MKKSGNPVRTIHDLVESMGSTSEFARWLGVTDSYVSNMMARGYLPSGFHMRVYLELERRGIVAGHELFDLDPKDGEVLDKLRASRPLARRRKSKADARVPSAA